MIQNGKEYPKKIELLIPELLENKISEMGSDLLVNIVREIWIMVFFFPLFTR